MTMQKNWIEIIARGPREHKDTAICLLIDAGSPGVVEAASASDQPLPFAVSHSANGIDAPAPSPTEVIASFTAYIPSEAFGALPELQDALTRMGWSFFTAPYTHTDWTAKWKRSVKPIRVTLSGRSIVIKPTWRTVKKRPGDYVIEIDPGMAFGTGGHATTKTCLKSLLLLFGRKTLRPRSASLLDVGTGTGILAIAAVKLGMKKVVGIDIDPEAVKAARANARLNKTRVTLSARPVQEVRGRFSCVAANILGCELHRLSNVLADKVGPSGFIILSGMLTHERKGVVDAYAALGFKVFKTYSSGEWVTLVMDKNR